MSDIKKISNRQLTELRKLGRKKYRSEYELFIAEGLRTVEQIIENNQIEVETLFLDEKSHLWEERKWSSVLRSYEWYIVPEKDYMEISDTENPQGIMAVCQMPAEESLGKLGSAKGCIVAVDRIQDPGNLGTILRTATWFGAAGVVFGKGTVGQYHPKVVRSTAGATGFIPGVTDTLDKALEYLENQGWQVALLDGKPGAHKLPDFKPHNKIILVVGNEAGGIDRNLLKENRIRLAIPGYDKQKGVESLNAAMALGISLYDITEKLNR
jgi:TrmH family RNA methyltransferase